MRAQGALEYLIIIAAVLGISAVVVLFVGGAFIGSSGGADISKCRLAAANCQKDMATGLSITCPYCDTACKDASGKDLLSGTLGCGLACTQCKAGSMVSSGGGATIGLAGWWKFDEGSGTTVTDSSGNGNTGTYFGGTYYDGTLSGPAWTTDAKYGNAVYFDASGGFISTPYNGKFLQEMTFSVWFKIKDWGSRAVIGRFHNSAGWDQGWMLYRNAISTQWPAGTLGWLFYYNHTSGMTYNVLPTYTGLATDTWYYATAVIYPNGNYTTYLNGAPYLWGTVPNFLKWGGSNPDENTRIAIGRCSSDLSSWPFYGTIDAARVWNTSLNQSEIVDEMNSARSYSRTLGDWELDEGVGTTTRDTHIWTMGKKGYALSFNGLNDYASKTSVSNLSTSNLTISLWVKQNGTSGWFMHPMGVFGEHRATIYVVPGSYVYYYKFQSISENHYETAFATLDSNWHHIAQVFNGTHIRAYVDSVLKNERAASGIINKIDDSIFIGTTGTGASPQTNYYRGLIDDVRVYYSALTETIIAQIYREG